MHTIALICKYYDCYVTFIFIFPTTACIASCLCHQWTAESKNPKYWPCRYNGTLCTTQTAKALLMLAENCHPYIIKLLHCHQDCGLPRRKLLCYPYGCMGGFLCSQNAVSALTGFSWLNMVLQKYSEWMSRFHEVTWWLHKNLINGTSNGPLFMKNTSFLETIRYIIIP